MARKQVISKDVKEIKQILEEDNAIIGADRTLKMLKQGRINKVFMASNCPEDLRKDLEKYSKFADVELVKLKQDNEQLGTICKKQHFISVLSQGA